MTIHPAVPMAHVAPGLGEIIGLGFVSVAALFGVATFVLFESKDRGPHRRALATGAAVLTGASVVLAYAFPLMIKGPSTLFRPHATARLEIRSPFHGEVFHGHPAEVPVELALVGGRLVAATTRKVVPNVGHIHVYLDGKLLSMTTSLRDQLEVGPGEHVLEVEFVAGDHGPFNPLSERRWPSPPPRSQSDRIARPAGPRHTSTGPPERQYWPFSLVRKCSSTR